MRLRHVYLLLAILGAALPLALLFPFFRQHGLDVPLLFAQLFSTPSGAFFGMDVILSSIVLWIFVSAEKNVPHRWAPIVASLLVGVSLGLPLFLYLRERSARP